VERAIDTARRRLRRLKTAAVKAWSFPQLSARAVATVRADKRSGRLATVTERRRTTLLSSLLCPVGRGGFFDELQGIVDQDFARHLARRRARDVVVAFEAVEVFFGEDVAEGVVRKAEQQVVLALHLSLEIETDVRQRFAGDRQDLRVADVHEVHSRGDRL